MKKSQYKLSVAFSGLLLLACCVMSTHAQPAAGSGEPSGGPRRPREERQRPPQPGMTQVYDRRAVEQATAQPLNSVRVLIRYKKEYGYKFEGAWGGVTGPTSCGAFSVFGQSKQPSQEKPIGVHREDKMTEEDGYYFCEFLVFQLPLDQEVTISASMGDGLELLTEAWRGGSQSRPPSGWRRVVDEGTRTVTLTASEPRATVAFEMVYAPSREFVVPRRHPGSLIFKKP